MRDRKQVRLQISEDLQTKLKNAAKTNGRTFNGEVSARLEQSLQANTIHELELILTNMQLALRR